ncbi:diguanylate cyclase [Thalassospira lucentensis]|uniref:GGDEF domain-containing protein n=1 Tax=Thalassospira lucentensis TaxID=168935 RepID=UPI003D2F13AC
MAKQSDQKHDDVPVGLKLGSTIAARQLKYSLFLAAILGFIIVGVRGYQDYEWLEDVYQQGTQRSIASSIAVANQILTNRDLELAEVMARGMMNNRSIARVTLLNEADGIFFETKRPAGEIPTSRWAEKMFGGLQTIVVPVRDPNKQPATTIGEMVVDLNPQVFVSAYMSRLSLSFLSTMVLAVLMAAVFAGMSYFVFSRPLVRLGNYLVKSDPTDDKRPLEMPPHHRYDDEVQLLGSVTVGLFGMIRGQVGQLRKARDALQSANINLEARVEQRTKELNEAMQKLEVLASTDPLTELPNRRAYLGRQEEAISIWCRRDTPVSIILLDIDRFKAFNDTYGHQAGDAVLVELAKTMERTLRTIDMPARLGGEEFAVLLPGEEFDGAMKLAERLRVAFEETRVEFGGNTLSFTSSFGVSSLPSKSGMADFSDDVIRQFDALKNREISEISATLYSMADSALYLAKESGRNRCEVADFHELREHTNAVSSDILADD